jgi:hypothetical protein
MMPNPVSLEQLMSNESQKWMLGLVLLGMLADTVIAHPALEVKGEYQYKGLVPQQAVHGFANERQWLFAHRKFRNQCVLEALAAEGNRSGDNVHVASARSDDGISPDGPRASYHY